MATGGVEFFVRKFLATNRLRSFINRAGLQRRENCQRFNSRTRPIRLFKSNFGINQCSDTARLRIHDDDCAAATAEGPGGCSLQALVNSVVGVCSKPTRYGSKTGEWIKALGGRKGQGPDKADKADSANCYCAQKHPARCN